LVKFLQPFCLSDTGSTRATAYNWGNKILTVDGKTHVVWLDAVATICGRSYDHQTQTWGEMVRIDDGCDNHACPCITADAAGHIRLTFGPHGWNGAWNEGRVKWKRSLHPGNIAAWEPVGEGYKSSWNNFGYNATAASIVHTPAGLDAVVCRGGEHPPQTMFHLQRKLGGWSSAKPLFSQEVEPQYTHNYGHIACAADNTLYAACHFYNIGGSSNQPVTGDRSRMRSYGAAVLKSVDLGNSWTSLRGEEVDLPATYQHQIAIPPLDRNIYVNSIALDASAALWALTLNPGLQDDAVSLSRWTGRDWDTLQLEKYVPEGRTAVEGMMMIDARDRLHIVLTTVDVAAVGTGSHWGHPSSEVLYLSSQDFGKTFAVAEVSSADPSVANWLPSISRSGPYHSVETPTIMYTQGVPGEGLRPGTETKVWCLQLAE
jgi:hypothetical protein